MTRPYAFSGSYEVPARRGAVIATLRDADHWPQWWPQIRSVERHDDDTGVAIIRSLLPITLRVRLIRVTDDPSTGTLRACLDGDLRGWIEMRVAQGRTPEASRVVYAQECVVAKRPLDRAPRVIRPALNVNHALMMRSGMRGLARHLSS